MPEPAPAARRIQLGIMLRGHRERRGLTPKEVANTMAWYSPVKVTKVEKGAVRLSPAETDRLIELFEIEGDEMARIRDYASMGRKQDPPVRQLDGTETLTALLSITSEIKYYGGDILPGFLQTEDYIRALLATSVDVPVSEIDRRVAERISRRRYLTQDNPPVTWIILDEAVLRRPVGGVNAHRAQLMFLRDTAELPNITLQVIPFDAGEHVAMGCVFTVLHVVDPQWTFVYTEGLSTAALFDRSPHIDVYRMAFDRLRMSAWDARQTRRMIDKRIKELR